MSCQNHVCGKKVNLNGEYHTCSLCKKPVYCSADCYMIDWPLHACANLFQVSTQNTLVAVPYFYEDTLTEKELSEIPISDPIHSNYSVMHVNPNRDVKQWTIDSVATDPISEEGRGIKPPTSLGKTFSMNIRFGDSHTHTVQGSIPNNCIYRGNLNNAIAHELSGRVGPAKENAVHIFWSKMDDPISGGEGKRKIPFHIEFSTSKSDPISFKGFIAKPQKQVQPARRVQQHLQSKLETKFKSPSTARGLHVYRCTDDKKNSVLMTLSHAGALVDVEVVLRKEPETEKMATTITRFRCNPRDLESMVGMTMALEKAVAEGEKVETLGVVRNYTQALLDNPEEVKKVPNDVNAAVGVSLDGRFAQISEPARQLDYLSKIVRARDAPKMAETLADELISEIRAARSGSGILNNKYTRDAIVGRISKKIDDLMAAINQQMANIKRAAPGSIDVKMYKIIVEKLQEEGKSPN